MARMAQFGLFVFLTVAFVTMSPQLSAGQLAPAPTLDCSSDLAELLPCLDFLTNASVISPAALCCGALTNVSTASPACLCQLVSPSNANETAQLGVNDTRALQLPGLCSLNLNVGSCAAILGPSVAPVPALVPSPVALAPAPVSLAPAVSPSLSPSLSPVLAPESDSPASSPITAESPGPSADCSTEITSLSTCLNFLTGAAPSPPATCCTNLGTIVGTAPQCLSQLVAQAGSIAGVNATLVEELPTTCAVPVSSSLCSSAGAPALPIGGIAGPEGSTSDNGATTGVAFSGYMMVGIILGTLVPALLQ